MAALPAFPIQASSPLCRDVRGFGVSTFAELTERVRAVPYGRPASTLSIAVLAENRGTCSSKHRLLAEVAHECGHTEVTLVVGIYEMSEQNTPGVGMVLNAAGLTSILEAHCYLVFDGVRFDFTGLATGNVSPFESLIQENVVSPAELMEAKSRTHRQAIAAWAEQRGVSFENAWSIRERCIAALTSSA